MIKRFGSLAVVAAALIGWTIAGAPAVGQTLLSSFENDLSSTVGVDWTGTWTASPEFSAVGATLGDSAFVVKHATGWVTEGLILSGGLPLAEMTSQHGFLQLDLTSADLGIAADGVSPANRQLFVIFNMSGGGWNQNPQFDFPVAADDGTSLTSTYTLDLAAAGIQQKAQDWVAAFPTAVDPYFQIFLIWQGADQGVVQAGNYANDNQIVDAADYTVWRDSLDGTIISNETVSPGIVDSADYDEWKANFGNDYSRIETNLDNIRFVNAGSGGLGATGVPEPTSSLLALLAAVGLGAVRRVRR